MFDAEVFAGLAEGGGALARAVVGHDALNCDAEALIVGDGGLEDGAGAFFSLVGMDLGEGDTGVVVDTDMDEHPAGAAGLGACGLGIVLGEDGGDEGGDDAPALAAGVSRRPAARRRVMQPQLKLNFPGEPVEQHPEPPPAWESLQAEARGKALSRLAQLIARMLANVGAPEREAYDE